MNDGLRNQSPRSVPQTASGRELLEALSNLAAELPLEFGDEPLERLDIAATMTTIADIEREAAATVIERVRAAADHLVVMGWTGPAEPDNANAIVRLASVRAILDEAQS